MEFFFHILSQDATIVHQWCRQNGLLSTGFPCSVDGCSGDMVLRSLSRGHGGVVFRCSSNRNHTRSSRVHSIFEKSNLLIQDIMLFIKSYLERNSLAQCSRLQSTGPLSYARYLKSIFTPICATGH